MFSKFLILMLALLQLSADPILDQVKVLSQGQTAICELIDALEASSCVLQEGSDAELRPIYVGAQTKFEELFVHLLETKQVDQVVCLIHTPAPATPLCIKSDASDSAAILREFLKAGGIVLSLFPEGGRDLRSPEQLAILDDLCTSYPDNVAAMELECTEIPQDLTGATYFIMVKDEIFVLSLRSYQVNRPTDGVWGIWYGSLTDPAVLERMQSVSIFLYNNGFKWD